MARTPHDMVILRDVDEAVRSAARLAKFDRAFLKRSNGKWTCATLTDQAPCYLPSTKTGKRRFSGSGSGGGMSAGCVGRTVRRMRHDYSVLI